MLRRETRQLVTRVARTYLPDQVELRMPCGVAGGGRGVPSFAQHATVRADQHGTVWLVAAIALARRARGRRAGAADLRRPSEMAPGELSKDQVVVQQGALRMNTVETLGTD